MCFAPQRRAFSHHLNFQKCSENGVLCKFWLRNMLRATTACTFSSSQLPEVLREWCALYVWLRNMLCTTMACTDSSSQLPKVLREWWSLYVLTSKYASRHNGVQFFISYLARWLRVRRFSEPTFRSSGDTKHWKNIVFRDFSTFSRTCVFFPLTFSILGSAYFFSSLLWLFPPLLFHLSILSEVWLLNFLR